MAPIFGNIRLIHVVAFVPGIVGLFIAFSLAQPCSGRYFLVSMLYLAFRAIVAASLTKIDSDYVNRNVWKIIKYHHFDIIVQWCTLVVLENVLKGCEAKWMLWVAFICAAINAVHALYLLSSYLRDGRAAEPREIPDN